MELIIKKEVAEAIGFKKFERFSAKAESWSSWREEFKLDLGALDKKQLDALRDMLEAHKSVRGVNVLIYDLNAWTSLLKGGAADKKPRTVRVFETLLQQYLLPVPGHRIYKRHSDGAILCYYVSYIEYHPPREMSGGGKSAPYVSMNLVFEEIGGRASSTVTFGASDVMGKTTAQALMDDGLMIEDDILRADYLKQTERYTIVSNAVGQQFWGRGRANAVGNERGFTALDRYGEPARVVVDVFSEKGPVDSHKDRIDLHSFFWSNVGRSSKYNEEEDTWVGKDDEDNSLETPEIEIPIHPWIVIFHLAKHIRLQCHVGQLEEYVYDEHLADKLVLPEDQKSLVKLLIDTKGGAFQDIVQGKGGGAVVILTGEPGVGKTLTAEVYAESEKRALYSVQCSQLGVAPEKLEEALMLVFDRARRWNAVLLLDEADVYVHERGNSMAQNAIVGVFLRVLEYQGSTLFLTSNRPNDVDDAIASRCIARLHYTFPDPAHAERIWRVLADTANIPIDDYLIHQIVEVNPTMTGRDIKNILKLANLMRPEGESITFDQIEYVKQFKPTGRILEKK